MSTYPPPNCDASYQQHLITSLHNLPTDHDVIITGDFNSPDNCWYSLSAQQPFSKELCDLFFSLNLQQLVNSPSHMCGNTLDIVATNSPDTLHNVKVDDQNKFCISDHDVITFDVATRAMPIRSTETRRVKLYSRADFLSLDNSIADNLNLSSLQILPTTTDSLWTSIKSAIMPACQLHAPQITISSKQLPKWFNSETRHLLKQIHTLKRSEKRRSTMTKLQKISRMKNELTSELITAQLCYEDHLIQCFSSKPKKLFRYLQSVSVSKHSTSHLVVNSSPVTDPIKQAKRFKDYFHSTFTSSNYQLPDTSNLPAPISQLNTITVKSEETYRCLIELDPTKAKPLVLHD